MGSELRQSKRQRLTCGSTAVSLDGKTRHACRLADISATGARLLVDDAQTLPDRFALMLSERGKVLRFCRVVWRKKKQIGVAFRTA